MAFIKKNVGSIALTTAALSVAFLLLIYIPLLEFGFIRAAAYFGTLAGASVGFCALLAGHLFNSHLNRRRDHELRVSNAAACAAAVQMETAANVATIVTVLGYLDEREIPLHLHIVNYGEQFSTQVFQNNILGFTVGLVLSKGAVDNRNIGAFNANIQLLRTSMLSAAALGDKTIAPGDIVELRRVCGDTLKQAHDAISDIQRLRNILATSA